MLHHGVVDGNRSCRGERRGLKPQEIEVALRLDESAPASLDHGAVPLAKLMQIKLCWQYEHSAVPEVISRRQHLCSARSVWLLHKLRNVKAAVDPGPTFAAADIAVACLGTIGSDAERDQRARARGGGGPLDASKKSGAVRKPGH